MYDMVGKRRVGEGCGEGGWGEGLVWVETGLAE